MNDTERLKNELMTLYGYVDIVYNNILYPNTVRENALKAQKLIKEMRARLEKEE